ncbi:MAG: COG2426 family protein [Candidatus Aenigmatarchaeota archaeon]
MERVVCLKSPKGGFNFLACDYYGICPQIIMIPEIIGLVLVTFLPGLELRAGIPYGILGGKVSLPFGYTLGGLGLNPLIVVPVVLLANILLGEFIFWALNTILPYVLKIKPLERVYTHCVRRVQKKARTYVGRYGVFGLALFIGVPLPGSGVWSGALAAFILGFAHKGFSIANVAGVLIAGTIVTLLTLGVLSF